MKTPSITVGVKGGKYTVLYCGEDGGKAKDTYQANTGNTELDGVFLIIRPEYTRRIKPAKSGTQEPVEAKPKKKVAQ